MNNWKFEAPRVKKQNIVINFREDAKRLLLYFGLDIFGTSEPETEVEYNQGSYILVKCEYCEYLNTYIETIINGNKSIRPSYVQCDSCKGMLSTDLR